MESSCQNRGLLELPESDADNLERKVNIMKISSDKNNFMTSSHMYSIRSTGNIKQGWVTVFVGRDSPQEGVPLISLPSGLQAVHTLMDGSRYTVTLEEFKLFHGIDRSLYIVLVRDLGRNPLESLYIMGLWLWLERGGFYNFISKILPLPPFLINELADEAVTCLKCVNINFPLSSEASEIPLTHSLVKKDISLKFFQENHLTALHEIESLVSGVCIPSLSDIMETSCRGFFGETSTQSQMQAPTPVDSLAQNISGLRINSGDSSSPRRGRAQANEMSRNERTMFVTFSKGYPVTENEVRQFFTRLFGNCIESFHMQDLRHDEQPLYAKIVFVRPCFIRAILSGVSKAKFTINGKHVWMRKFVPKNDRPLDVPVL